MGSQALPEARQPTEAIKMSPLLSKLPVKDKIPDSLEGWMSGQDRFPYEGFIAGVRDWGITAKDKRPKDW